MSVSTASRALNNYPDITESTRAKVQAVAEQLGYRAHGTARSLRVGDARMIAAIVDFESLHPAPGRLSDFWAMLLAELTAQLSERGYGLLTVMHGHATPLLKQMPYDAALLLTTRVDVSDVIDAVPFGVALVTATGQDQPERRHMSVGHDYVEAARAVFEHLREAGARRPAFVAPDLDHTLYRGLELGTQAWAEATGTPVHRTQLVSGELQAALEDALAHGCDGLFVTGADSATVLSTLQNLGHEPGRDVLVVVQSDSPTDKYLKPTMTALAFDPMASAAAVVAAVDEALRGGTGQVDVGFTLRIGQSTQRPAS